MSGRNRPANCSSPKVSVKRVSVAAETKVDPISLCTDSSFFYQISISELIRLDKLSYKTYSIAYLMIIFMRYKYDSKYRHKYNYISGKSG